jgi:hypothetical protein
MSELAYAMTPIAGVALGAAVRSASERRRAATVVGLARGLLALGTGYGGLEAGRTGMPTATMTLVAVGGVALSLLGLALTMRRRRSLSKSIPPADSSRLTWMGTVAVDLCTCLVLLGTELVGVVGFVAALVGLATAPLVLLVRTWQLVSDRRRRLAALYLAGPVLLVLGLPLPGLLPFGLLAVRCFVLVVPVVTLCLLPSFPLPGSTKLAMTLGAVLLVPQVGFAFWHVDRCAGELQPAEAPADWKARPVVAEGSGGSLGRFSLRWQQSSYKNYPAPFENMELADDELCFGSTLSLDQWFGASREVLTHEPAMYRSPSELRLRYEPRRALYIVSAKAWSEGPEALLVAFRRRLGLRVRFDTSVSLAVFAVGAALFVVGGYGLWRKRNARALALLLLSASGPFVYEAIADVFELARPGHEFRRSVGTLGTLSIRLQAGYREVPSSNT